MISSLAETKRRRFNKGDGVLRGVREVGIAPGLIKRGGGAENISLGSLDSFRVLIFRVWAHVAEDDGREQAEDFSAFAKL